MCARVYVYENGGEGTPQVRTHTEYIPLPLLTNPMSSHRSEPADKMYQNDKSVNYDEAEEEDVDMFEKDLLEDAQWKLIQQNTFTRWANEKLKAVSKHIVDLESDLSDGLRLINLIEVLSQKQLPKHNKKPIFISQKLENVSVALKFLEDEGIRIVNIGE